MDNYILNLSDSEIQDMTKNIDSQKLCLLMMVLEKPAQNKILGTMSEKAQSYLMDDVKKLETKINA